MTHASFGELSDRDLISEVKRLAGAERSATAALVASLAEMDARRLYLGEGCSSLFTYCTRVLHLSEHAAYARIETARAVRRFPLVLDRLERAELTLTGVSLLRPHLTDANCLQLLDAARHASKRDVERLIAAIAPRPDAPAMIRKLPAPLATPSAAPERTAMCECSSQSPTRRQSPEEHAAETAAVTPAVPVVPKRPTIPVVRPLAPERYKVQFTIGRETHEKLRRAQDLLRHTIPDGDPAALFDRALTALLEQLERKKLAAARQARPPLAGRNGSRHIPAAVRREVWKRDEGRCAFEGIEGRCGDTAFLEFYHLVSFAKGGRATAENIQLRCRAHNEYHAVEEFGDRAIVVREDPAAYVIPWRALQTRTRDHSHNAAKARMQPPDVETPRGGMFMRMAPCAFRRTRLAMAAEASKERRFPCETPFAMVEGFAIFMMAVDPAAPPRCAAPRSSRQA
ncbi:MAG TPA: hypothetical protein VNR64_21935 [Vicinamibacterales bacterium]|nr:hypothetical protein [Vicinamibacterales bacterium]